MSVWQKISEFFTSVGDKPGLKKTFSQLFDVNNLLPGGRDAAFTLALVALLAKMAGADGVVTNSEVVAFRASVDVPKGSEKQVERLFELAQQDVAGFETYAKKIKKLFFEQPQTLEHVLESLFYIGAADGIIHEAEMDYLKAVSDIFGFDDKKFEQIAAAFIIDENKENPYLVLGLTPDVGEDEVRRVYKNLASENHPDRLIAKGVPKEMLDIANARMASINVAYKAIAEMRNI